MGNSASKKAKQEQLEAAEQKYTTAVDTIAARDTDLAQKEREIEDSRKESSNASNEATTLRKRVQELDALCKTLEQEQQKQVAQLRSDLKNKGDETVAQRRVVDSRTKERDEARRLQALAEDKAKDAEQTSQVSLNDFQKQKRQLEEASIATSMEMESARKALASLTDKVKTLEANNLSLAEELSSARNTAAAELEAAKAAAASQLSSAQSSATEQISAARIAAAEELAAAKASMTDSQRTRAQLDEDLSVARRQLAASTSRLEMLQKTNNESISRRAASHEAFTAMKQELSEAQEKYRALHSKSSVDLEAAKREAADERERRMKMEMEMAVLQKRVADAESLHNTPKIDSAVRIQEIGA